ncbi:MAG: transcriptional repressor [Desulfuromonadaceae bacterium]|jgi:Fur family transcriptional regulator, peroxide stress response regulator
MEQNSRHFTYIKNKSPVAGGRINGIPSTPQRQAVLQALAVRDKHSSADEIYQQAKKLLHGLSRRAVYQTLETLVKTGMVKSFESPQTPPQKHSGQARLLCIGCGQLGDLTEASLEDLVPWYQQPQEGQLNNYSFVFTGLCSHCLADTKTGKFGGQ